MERFLVVGLGNPGKAYERTRHNVGFRVVEAAAQKYGLSFRRKWRFQGELAEVALDEEGSLLFLVKPRTYMNRSGEAVLKAMRSLKVELKSLLVVVDDIDLPFGRLRMRAQGSAGTHNGLKSIEQNLQTEGYARLRIGIGAARGGELVDYVLDRFSSEEEKRLPKILEKSLAAIEVWRKQGIQHAMDFVNPSNPSKENI